MAIVRAISAQYRRFGHLQGITASTVRVLTPKTTSADDKRAKTRIFLIFVLLLHGSPRYRIKLNFGRIMRKFTRLRTRYALYTRHRQLQDTAVGAER